MYLALRGSREEKRLEKSLPQGRCLGAGEACSLQCTPSHSHHVPELCPLCPLNAPAGALACTSLPYSKTPPAPKRVPASARYQRASRAIPLQLLQLHPPDRSPPSQPLAALCSPGAIQKRLSSCAPHRPYRSRGPQAAPSARSRSAPPSLPFFEPRAPDLHASRFAVARSLFLELCTRHANHV